MATYNGNNSGDTYTGKSDPDLIYGGKGNDSLSGASGNDSIYGGEDRDSLYGEGDNDLLDGGTLTDSLFGGAGNDSLFGGADSDTLIGDEGNDFLDGGNGNDSLFGGGGADHFALTGTFGNDTLSGGETDSATDTVDASGLSSGVTVSVTSAEAGTIFITGYSGNTAGFTGMEAFTLTASADTFTALKAGSAVVVDGGAGNDMITGSSVNDTLSGGTGVDTIAAGGGADTVYDEFQGNSGAGSADIVDLGAGNDIYIGSGTGAADRDLIYGGTGNDTITTAGGTDTAYGGDGDDVITAGNDTLASNGDLLSGDAGNDIILGGNTNDTLLGGIGADSMQGGGGNDLMYGGSNAGIGTNLISNGDFSSGPTGWSGTDLETNFTEGAYLANGSTNAVAETDGNTGQTTVMQQSFTVSGMATANVAFRSVLRNDAAAQVGTDGFRVEMLDSSGTVISTINVFPPPGTWTNYAIPVTFPTAGTYMLRFTELGNNDSLGPIIDDIQVISTTVAVDTSGDTLDGGDGNDAIHGEGGNDNLASGAGQDSLYGGADNDTLAGGAGADSLTGGSGTDTATYAASGSGVNVTLGGTGSGGDSQGDSLSGIENLIGSDHDDTLTGDAGDNQINAGNGDDLIASGGGVDLVYGGSGNDTIGGGDGNDMLDGGTGDDSLGGGDGLDTIFGGDGRDTLVGGNIGDLVDGGEGGDDVDTLDLTGAGPFRIIRDPMYPDNPEMGIVQFLDPTDRHVVGEMSFRNVENIIPCFTSGTRILTERGPVAIDELAVGDLIVTRDHGLQPLRWIGQRDLNIADLIVQPQLQPVQIAAGALGAGLPTRALLVSPQHRMLMEGARAELLFGDAEVLVAATHLTGLAQVFQVLTKGVRYIHLLFDTHELIEAEGAWTESFQPAARTCGAMDAEQRAEISALFPELDQCLHYPVARQTLKAYEAQLLITA